MIFLYVRYSALFFFFFYCLVFRYGIKLLLSLFGSVIADQETKKYILLSLRAILQHQSLANDLYVRQNLHSWIVLTLQVRYTYLTLPFYFQILFLSNGFCALGFNLEHDEMVWIFACQF